MPASKSDAPLKGSYNEIRSGRKHRAGRSVQEVRDAAHFEICVLSSAYAFGMKVF